MNKKLTQAENKPVKFVLSLEIWSKKVPNLLVDKDGTLGSVPFELELI